ncbi:hypothetical protein ASE70_01475 [Sphingomonas sp. Leaf22]|uniref:hypothetical protein n=1 Tax=Sphingomonas sp. Leaf22 TaxID=1735687 RepID=UPI0006FE34B5|nr:hypothetical protein [Sphingomonas sp. Leaf22]KQM95412.1 hypothetical protein ASE70_01475 [Sphingomonas sp. Leaf22]
MVSVSLGSLDARLPVFGSLTGAGTAFAGAATPAKAVPGERTGIDPALAAPRSNFDAADLPDAGNTGGGFGIPTFIPGEPRLYGAQLTARF